MVLLDIKVIRNFMKLSQKVMAEFLPTSFRPWFYRVFIKQPRMDHWESVMLLLFGIPEKNNHRPWSCNWLCTDWRLLPSRASVKLMVFHAGTTICPSAITAGSKQWLVNYNMMGQNVNTDFTSETLGKFSLIFTQRDLQEVFVQHVDGSDVLEISSYIYSWKYSHHIIWLLWDPNILSLLQLFNLITVCRI